MAPYDAKWYVSLCMYSAPLKRLCTEVLDQFLDADSIGKAIVMYRCLSEQDLLLRSLYTWQSRDVTAIPLDCHRSRATRRHVLESLPGHMHCRLGGLGVCCLGMHLPKQCFLVCGLCLPVPTC